MTKPLTAEQVEGFEMRDMRFVFLQFMMGITTLFASLVLTNANPVLRGIAFLVGLGALLKAMIDMELEKADRKKEGYWS